MNFMNNNNNNNNPYAGGDVYDPFATQINGNTNNQNMYNTNNIGPNTAPTNNVYQNSNVRAPYLDPGPVFTAVAFDARPYVRFSSYNIPAFTGYVLDSPKLKAAKDIIVMILFLKMRIMPYNPLMLSTIFSGHGNLQHYPTLELPILLVMIPTKAVRKMMPCIWQR